MYSIYRRQTCPGGAYYVCQSGFKGCCSNNPCGPGNSCLDNTLVISVSPKTTLSMSTEEPNTVTVSQPAAPVAQTASPTSTKPTSTSTTTIIPLQTSANLLPEAESAVHHTSSTFIRDVSGLTCPASNSTTITDDNRNSYNIRCSMDNSYTSFSTVNVSGGGFSECFNSCDNLTACAGFTFVGLDGGSCYLKQSMPTDTFVAKAGSNYVSGVRVSKVDVVLPPSTSSTSSAAPTSTSTVTFTSSPVSNSTQTPGTASKPSAGVIAGSVTGGVASIILILLFLAFLFRKDREKKRLEKERAATKMDAFLGPKENPKKGEVFAPYGGFYREGVVSRKTDDSQATVSTTDSYDYAKEAYVQKRGFDDIGPAQLDGRPVYKDSLREPPSHAFEMDDTSYMAIKSKQLSPTSISSESPVPGRSALGSMRMPDEMPGRSHMMSWNNYDDREAVSPPSAMSAGLSPMIVSPPDETPSAGHWQRPTQQTRSDEQPYQYPYRP